MSNLPYKSLFALTPQDFDTYALWTEVDDDDTVVACRLPIAADDLLDGIYYCRADFQFADQTEATGYLRLSDGVITTLTVWRPLSHAISYSLLAAVRAPLGDTPQQWASVLGKTLAQVFPLCYRCQLGAIRFAGIIDADTHMGLPVHLDT